MSRIAKHIKLAAGRAVATFLRMCYRRRARGSLVRLGTAYGGWNCESEMLKRGGLAICVGAGEDVSFDVALCGRYGLDVWCVDPTPRAITHVSSLLQYHSEGRTFQIEGGPEKYDLTGFDASRFRLFPIALSGHDGTIRLYAPADESHVSHSALNLQGTLAFIDVKCRRLVGLLWEMGGISPDLLKLDIEGAEYEVLEDMLSSGVRPRQLLIEFDELAAALSLLMPLRILHFIRKLLAEGYTLVEVENFNFSFVRYG